MTTKTINIAGKEVTLAYCYGTEIAFKMLSDEDIIDFFKADVFPAVSDKKSPRMPDRKKTIFLILAAANSYYDSIEKECPVTDKDLMYKTKVNDLPDALAVILELYTNFYKTPSGEPEDDKDEDNAAAEKNA